ncbi:MAG: asparagine synthase-related protein [Candidatus Bathyarchaeia archaeon]
MKKSYKNKILKVFYEVIQDYVADSIMLSGGLDTSIIACISSKFFKPIALTVGFAYGNAPDIDYAKLIAKQFNLKNEVKLFNLEEAIEAATYVIKTIKSFDPIEVRNDLVIYIGMKFLKDIGMKSVITGDGGDELFAGYPFLFKLKLKEVDEWIKKVVKKWFFASKIIGESLGLKVLQPFMDNRIVDLALEIPAKIKISKYNGTIYGKYILRKAFEKLLPIEVVWRDKHPIEVGSGSIALSKMLKLPLKEFIRLSKMVNLKTQEQAYYFKIYLETVGEIPRPKEGEKACPNCGGGIPLDKNYCKICGGSLMPDIFIEPYA